jgi:putative transposase
MFTDEARFGRMNRLRPCWAPIGIRPGVAAQLIREYIYFAVSPKDGTCVYLIMPTSNTECFQVFLEVFARKFAPATHLAGSRRRPQPPLRRPCRSRQHHTLVSSTLFAGAQSQENLWDEIREKIFKNYALKSVDAVRAKLKEAILYIERNPELVRSITAFPYIVNSL